MRWMQRVASVLALVFTSCGGGGGGGNPLAEHNPALLGTWKTIWFTSPSDFDAYTTWDESVTFYADGTYTVSLMADGAYEGAPWTYNEEDAGTWESFTRFFPPDFPGDSPGELPMIRGSMLTKRVNGGAVEAGGGAWECQYALDPCFPNYTGPTCHGDRLALATDPTTPATEEVMAQYAVAGRDWVALSRPAP